MLHINNQKLTEQNKAILVPSMYLSYEIHRKTLHYSILNIYSFDFFFGNLLQSIDSCYIHLLVNLYEKKNKIVFDLKRQYNSWLYFYY